MRGLMLTLVMTILAFLAPARAEAGWPIVLDTWYCWSTAAACTSANGTLMQFELDRNGTGVTSEGYDIRWRFNAPHLGVRFDAWPNATYVGRRQPNGCFTGTMTTSDGASGTWSACLVP